MPTQQMATAGLFWTFCPSLRKAPLRSVANPGDPDDLQAIAAAVNRRLEIDRP